MTDLEKLVELRYWLDDNVEQGHTAHVSELPDGTRLTQSDCIKALDAVLGPDHGNPALFHAYTIYNLAHELPRQPIPTDAAIAPAIRAMALSIGYLCDHMYALDFEVSDRLGLTISHVRDQFNDLAASFDDPPPSP